MSNKYSSTVFSLLLSILVFSVLLTGKLSAFPDLQNEAYLPIAEVMPEPVGGLPAIYKKLSYPEFAKKAHIEGKVYAMVMVNEKGGVDDVKIIKGIGGGCDEEVVSVLKKTKFTPAKNNGANVKSKLSLPISFKL